MNEDQIRALAHRLWLSAAANLMPGSYNLSQDHFWFEAERILSL